MRPLSPVGFSRTWRTSAASFREKNEGRSPATPCGATRAGKRRSLRDAHPSSACGAPERLESRAHREHVGRDPCARRSASVTSTATWIPSWPCAMRTASTSPCSARTGLSASWLTVSRACTARVAGATSSWPFRARAVASAPLVADGAWPTRPHTWSTTCCPACRCASGCSGCAFASAICWPSTPSCVLR